MTEMAISTPTYYTLKYLGGITHVPVLNCTNYIQVVYFFFQRLDEVVSHGGYTALRASQHYNARCFTGSMCHFGEQAALA